MNSTRILALVPAAAAGILAGLSLGLSAEAVAFTQITYGSTFCQAGTHGAASPDDLRAYANTVSNGVGLTFGSYSQLYLHCPIIDSVTDGSGGIMHHSDFSTVRVRGYDALNDNSTWAQFCLTSTLATPSFWCGQTRYVTSPAGGSATPTPSYVGDFYLDLDLGGSTGIDNPSFVYYRPTVMVVLSRNANNSDSLRAYEIFGQP